MNVSQKKKLSLFNQEKYIKVQCIIFILNNTMLVNGGHTLSTEHAELCWKAKDNFFMLLTVNVTEIHITDF